MNSILLASRLLVELLSETVKLRSEEETLPALVPNSFLLILTLHVWSRPCWRPSPGASLRIPVGISSLLE